MKREPIHRIDLRTTTPVGGAPIPSVIIQAGTGNADRLDGYDSSMTGAAYTIPVLDEWGKLPASVIPDGAEFTSGSSGIIYMGPTTRLATALRANDVYIELSANVVSGNEMLVLSRYGQAVEHVKLLGAATDMGGGKWRAPVARAQNQTKAAPWLRGTFVISLGKPDSGGFVVVNSASTNAASGRGLTGYPPYIATYANIGDGTSPEWRAQFGYLYGVPTEFKDLFTSVYDDTPINWDSFGFAGQNAFLSGGIYARYGNIAGALDVTGTLTVYDEKTPARVSFGQTPAGFGMSLQDANRRPIWTLAAAYYDEESDPPTFDSDTVWVVEARGDRVIWLKAVTANSGERYWSLQWGPFDVQRDLLTSLVEDVDGPNVVIRPDINSYRFGPMIVSSVNMTSNVPLTVYGQATVTGTLQHTGASAGFFNAAAVGRQFVTGAKDSNAALASLITAMVNLGLITDGTS